MCLAQLATGALYELGTIVEVRERDATRFRCCGLCSVRLTYTAAAAAALTEDVDEHGPHEVNAFNKKGTSLGLNVGCHTMAASVLVS